MAKANCQKVNLKPGVLCQAKTEMKHYGHLHSRMVGFVKLIKDTKMLFFSTGTYLYESINMWAVDSQL